MWMAEGRIATCTVEITQYALKGQKLLAQGIALGNYESKPVALFYSNRASFERIF